MRPFIRLRWVCCSLLLFCAGIAGANQASLIADTDLIQAEALAKIIQSPGRDKPLMLQVGSRVLFQQAHIPGSEYVGAGNTDAGLQALKKRVESVPKSKFIVIYCGCCPWNHCPNVEPADKTLRQLGFTNVKTLYIGNNFGMDWVQRGYPTAKGD
ncbi:MAG TPA: rhodanese-like domain-containing protein [Terriglobales bacterium]|nr:rhodanese-like domain-containing protein [Terriglobales bacterium]